MELTGTVFVQEGHSARDEINGALKIVGFGARRVFQLMPQENALPRACDERVEEEGRKERQVDRDVAAVVGMAVLENCLDDSNSPIGSPRSLGLDGFRLMLGVPVDEGIHS